MQTLLDLLSWTPIAVLLRLILIVALVILSEWALRLAARQVARWLARVIQDAERVERTMTIVQVVRGTIFVVVVIVAALMALQTVGVNIGPLLAGVGVVGLAISLGAQTLIRDYLGGLLILLGNEFAIGDTIRVAGVEGEVEQITLRATYLRSEDGTFHTVPNGEIRLVSNLTMEWARAVVELGVDAAADMTRVMQTLDKALRQARTDEAVRVDLLDLPRATGWVGFKDGAVQVRLAARTRPGKQWAVAVALRRYAVEALQAEGIKVVLS
jgi:small-conductance mechanosensitive channel